MAEFVSHHVRNPAVAAADLKIPVGEPEVQCVFARDGAAVAVKSIVQDRTDAREWFVVAARNGIVDGFGIGRNLSGVRRIFDRVDELEMFRTCGFPFYIALVTVKTDCVCCARQKKCGTDSQNALNTKLHNRNLEF